MTLLSKLAGELMRAIVAFILLSAPFWLGCAASIEWNIAQQSTTTGTVEGDITPKPPTQP